MPAEGGSASPFAALAALSPPGAMHARGDTRHSLASDQLGRSMHELGFGEGDRVWTPCTRNGFRPSTIVHVNDDASLLVECKDDGASSQPRRSKVMRSEVRPFYDYGPSRTWADNTEMVHLDDANILENIRRRYLQDDPYTYTANVLLAVNPYKHIPGLYGPEKIRAYGGKNLGALPPHPYAIADRAYRRMLREERNQALVISGESGAGKTETAKVTMHYLTQISRTGQEHGGKIQDKIISSSPILESFGNASTVRNMNSSRFGKYNTMNFNRVGQLKFSGIQTYLLEASRVVRQQPRERNFHVFYEMLAGLDDGLKLELLVDSQERYRLLYADGAEPHAEGSAEQRQERAKFEELRGALSVFVPADTQRTFWEVLAALIHLGEARFVDLCDASAGSHGAESSGGADLGSTAGDVPHCDPASDEAQVRISPESIDNLAHAAFLLGVSQEQLENALKWKERKVEGKPSLFSPRTRPQAEQTLQSIIKILYKRLFDHIVGQINESSRDGYMETEHEACRINSIGTLDIYGFERLQVNSFEQLCINLANERLQHFFIEEVLSAEQNSYRSEGLSVCSWELPDNTAVVNGISSVITILNQYSLRFIKNLIPAKEEKDAKFCEAVHQEHCRDGRGAGAILALRLDGAAARAGTAARRFDGFQIRHYAGDVSYSTAGWIDKNSDSLVPEIEALLTEATKPLTQVLGDRAGIDAKKTVNSVSTKYLNNLNSLLATLKACSVHYIRCFNPNDQRQAGVFQNKYVLDQVIQCGTVELVKIMHDGFPNRCNLKDLRTRFEALLPADFQRYSNSQFITGIMMAFRIPRKDWAVGVTQLFMKAGQLRILESLRDSGDSPDSEVVRRIRLFLARTRLRGVLHAVHLVVWSRRRRMLALRHNLQKACRIYVRIARWLAATRLRMYGPPRVEEEQEETPEEALALEPPTPEWTTPPRRKSTTACAQDAAASAHERRTRRQFPTPTNGYSPQLFVALNSDAEGQYAAFLQSDINMANPIADDILKLWQRNTTESVLFHDGRQVISSRLSSAPFLRGERGSNARAEHRSLDDIRRVDCHETGRAFPVHTPEATSGSIPAVVCMCQHKVDRQIFATCDDRNRISMWWWSGTDSSDVEKPALRIMGGLCPRLEPETSVYHMCFLSAEVLPRRIVEKDGRVIVLLTHRRGSKWLSMEVMSVYAARFHLECIQQVQIDSCGSDRKEAEVSFFTTSYSDRILLLGGRGLLQFWQVYETPSGQIELQLIENVASTFRDIKNNVMVSVLSTPPPLLLHGMQDWVMVGSSDGVLYGWKFDNRDDHTIRLDEQVSGRFRGNSHTQGVPIRSLVGTFGGSPDAHHRQLRSQGLSYSLFLNKVSMDERGFYSLGDDGKLLSWSLMDGQGWTRTLEVNILESSPASGPCMACHSSRLVPHIMVVSDTSRKLLKCYNRLTPEDAPEDAAVYAV